MTFMEFRGPGFVMEVPTDWLITSSTQFQVMFIGPKLSGSVRANLIVAIRPTQTNVTPTEVAAAALKTQQKEYSQFAVVEEFDFTEQGGSGFMRRFTWHDEETNEDIFQTQAFFIAGNALFSLTATRLRDVGEEFDSIFDQMMGSFRFVAV